MEANSDLSSNSIKAHTETNLVHHPSLHTKISDLSSNSIKAHTETNLVHHPSLHTKISDLSSNSIKAHTETNLVHHPSLHTKITLYTTIVNIAVIYQWLYHGFAGCLILLPSVLDTLPED
jgi:hypothetical protein